MNVEGKWQQKDDKKEGMTRKEKEKKKNQGLLVLEREFK